MVSIKGTTAATGLSTWGATVSAQRILAALAASVVHSKEQGFRPRSCRQRHQNGCLLLSRPSDEPAPGTLPLCTLSSSAEEEAGLGWGMRPEHSLGWSLRKEHCLHLL